jgi:hypothetical protein
VRTNAHIEHHIHPQTGNAIEVAALPAQMNETDVIEALDQACQGLNLIFQVVHDPETLYVYANRSESEPSFSYETLTEKVQGAIVAHQESTLLQLPHLQTLHLYSRELGTIEPDWEITLVLPSAEAETPEASTDAVSAVMQPDVLESENLQIESELSRSDLSHYCFTRNQALLTSEILPPTEKIARLVQSFHGLSLKNKLNALPHVEHFFRASSLPALDDVNVETQAWLHQLAQIDAANLRKTAIWMSRYCLSPEAAMNQVTVVLPSAEVTVAAVASETAAPQSLVQKMLAAPTEPSLEMYSSAAPARPRTAKEPEISPFQPSITPSVEPKSRPRFVWQMLLVPFLWLLFTATAVTYSVQAQNNSQASTALCKTANGSQPYCQLAAQLIGPEMMERFIKGTEAPMIEGVMEKSVQDCELAGYFNAGFTLKDDRELSTIKDPITSLQQETVFPGLFLVDLQHVGKAGGGIVRTACAYRQGVDPVMLRERPVKLASAVIPTDWPTQSFKSKTRFATLQTSLTAHGVLSHLGTSTLFTAIGIFVAVYLGLGISVDSLETIYKSAFFLGISETITGFIPMFGFFRIAVLEVLALMLTTVVVKGLELDWSVGYRWVACGGMTIIVIRAILNWLMLVTIVSLMS